ncbi:MAG: TolC family protein [Prevotella sp.]
MYKKQIIFILTAVCMFSSCGIYTGYHRKVEVAVDSLYRDAPCNLYDSTSLADFPWREFFNDSLLTQWIDRGLEHNSSLQIARLRTEEAQASLRAANYAFFPSLSLNPQGSVNSFGGEKPSKTYSLGGTAEWEIDAFGKLGNRQKGRRAALEASRAYEQAVQTDLVATIAETYYSLLAMDCKLSVTRETEQQWSEYARVMDALKLAGECDGVAVAQAEASRLEAAVTVVSLEKQIHELENSFSTLVGIVPTAIQRGSLQECVFNRDLSLGLPVQLLARRPDVRQKEWELAQAFYATNEARSAFYPSITLSGSAGWTNNSGKGIVNPGDWLLNAVGSLVQPIFDRGSNQSNLKIAKAQQQQAKISFTQTLLEAGAEVNNALTQWQKARQSGELNRQKVEKLKNALDNTRLLMEYGTTNYLEVLTARQALLQAQLAEVSDKYEEIQGVIQLYHALGGGY